MSSINNSQDGDIGKPCHSNAQYYSMSKVTIKSMNINNYRTLMPSTPDKHGKSVLIILMTKEDRRSQWGHGTGDTVKGQSATNWNGKITFVIPLKRSDAWAEVFTHFNCCLWIRFQGWQRKQSGMKFHQNCSWHGMNEEWVECSVTSLSPSIVLALAHSTFSLHSRNVIMFFNIIMKLAQN